MDANFQIEKTSSDTLKIVFIGKLDASNVAKFWVPCLAAITKTPPSSLVVDCKGVTYCDGAGIALIQALRNHQTKHNLKCVIDNLKADFQNLLRYIDKQPEENEHPILSYENFREHIGHIAVNFLNIFRENIVFLGALSCQLFWILLKPYKIRWRDFLRFIEETGPQALPIVALIGFLIGLISTFQAAPSFKDFGVQIYLINLVGLGLVREMGPLLTSVLIAGRTASSFAAEIGTMKINQEIDALTTMGLNPIRFLVIPRILAAMIITPILEAFFIIFGLLGCFVVMNHLGYTADSFFHQLYEAITPKDYIGGLIKVFFFGLVIAGGGCLHGIKTHFGAKAVGHSTTQAVVSSMIMLVIVDGIFAVIYYVLGV